MIFLRPFGAVFFLSIAVYLTLTTLTKKLRLIKGVSHIRRIS